MVILYPSYDIILSDDQLINQCKGSVNSGLPFILVCIILCFLKVLSAMLGNGIKVTFRIWLLWTQNM